MNETIIRAVILLMVFMLAGFLIGRATKGLIRLVVVGVLTMLFLIAARSMYNQIRESMTANSIPNTQPPQVNVSPTATANPTVSPSILASPSPTITPAATANSDTALLARTGLKNIPIFVSPYIASINGQAAAQSPSSQQPNYQPDYQSPTNQQPANQRPANQQPITGGW